MRKILLLATFFLSACSLTSFMGNSKKQDETIKLDAKKAQAMLAPGKSMVSGSALIKKPDGEVVTCAGSKVYLIPETDYAKYAMNILYSSLDEGFNPAANSRRIPDEDPDFMENTLYVKCNANGYFTFSGIATGTFYLQSKIVWMEDGRVQGGTVMNRIRVPENQMIRDFVLSPDEEKVWAEIRANAPAPIVIPPPPPKQPRVVFDDEIERGAAQ